MDLELHVDEYPEDDEEEASCEYCGAPLGMPCEPGCPNEEDPRDPDRAYDARVDQFEGKEPMSEFDKFMDRTLIDEKQRQRVDAHENNPQRRIAAKYQDRPMNKTRFTRGGR